jgi:cytosine/adenosine deaminase-related metal-dependent hydrolase
MIFLKDAIYIDYKTFEQKRTGILIPEGDNADSIFTDNIPSEAEIIDCKDLYVTKSFVNAHHHAYSALATGMPAPAKQPENFYEILKYVWWNLDKKLDKETIQASALVTAIESAKNGSTFVIDHHASPYAVENSLEIIAKAFEKIGISHLLCYEISDRDGDEIAQKGIDETENYLKNNQALVGMHASFTIGDKTMKKVADVVEKYHTGIHIHVAEDKIDQQLCEQNYNKRIIERLDEYNFLNNSKTILAHAIHINNFERKKLQQSKAFVVQNPESNLNNQVGFFDRKMLNNDQILLGTDGMHSDMIRSAQAAYFTGKIFDKPSLQSIYSQLRNNNLYLSKNNFKGDADNNFIILDYKPYTNFDKNNFLGHFFYAISAKNIKDVISNGKFIVKDRKIETIDENEIIKFAKEQAKKLWSKL